MPFARYRPPRPPPDPLILGYIAGFFDGEGHIHIPKRQPGTIHVGATQIAKAPLLLIREHFGGYLRLNRLREDRTRSTWAWEATHCQEVERFLLAVRPHLLVKGPKVDEALAVLKVRDWSVCAHGHAMVPDNTYVRPDTGGHDCRQCRRDHKKRQRGRQRDTVR